MKKTSDLMSLIKGEAGFVHVLLCILAMSILFCAWHTIEYYQVRRFLNAYERERGSSKNQSFAEEGEDFEEADEEVDSFTVVNRAPDYLKKRAISFAHQYNLGESVQQLYSYGSHEGRHEVTALEKKVSSKKSRKKAGRKKTTKNAAAEPYTRVHMVADPRFELPIEKHNFWLSSPFGPRRRSNGKREFHSGIDMAAVRGTPVKAAGDGVVVQAGNQPGYGNVIVIRHEDGFKTRYAHLSKIVVSTGEHVVTGQIIGKVGATGNARASGKTRDASHLHFEVEKQGKRVNPYYFFK